ncbi:hypothetical protein TTRE_0000124901 [Trichuris trichiura]|uniref:Uncharacterized protein n=1 Tax=Trichuris trichiura TaxID=36087 RepID=A0A077YYT5_TRITR|nr:hypothetical protein TTRE_0000124901 [Trichuris trichiura]
MLLAAVRLSEEKEVLSSWALRKGDFADSSVGRAVPPTGFIGDVNMRAMADGWSSCKLQLEVAQLFQLLINQSFKRLLLRTAGCSELPSAIPSNKSRSPFQLLSDYMLSICMQLQQRLRLEDAFTLRSNCAPFHSPPDTLDS